MACASSALMAPTQEMERRREVTRGRESLADSFLADRARPSDGGGASPLLLHSHVCRPPSPPSTSAHVCKCDMKMCVRVRRVQSYVVHTPHKGTNMAGEGP
jgi:hypothetical protein